MGSRDWKGRIATAGSPSCQAVRPIAHVSSRQAAGCHLPLTPGGRTGFATSPPGAQGGNDWLQA